MPTIIKMTLQQVLDKLKDIGTEQNIKTYKRHGAKEPLFGVSFANLGKLRSTIKKDHDLALKLWDSGNYDARNLATMIAEPAKFTREEAEHWIASAGAYGLVDLVADLISKAPFAEELMHEYMQSEHEYLKQGGYAILSCCLKNGTEISDSQCQEFLKTIEKEIHASPNRARHCMNMALIAIGIHKENLSKQAIVHAKKIGKVEVDHGDTSCTTPDAAAYIMKGKARPGKGS